MVRKPTEIFRVVLLCGAVIGVICTLFVGSVAGVGVAGDGDTAVADIENTAVDPALENRTGEVEVMARLETSNNHTISQKHNPVSSLQTEAAVSQQPLESFATKTEGVEVVDQFWIANAVLLMVDTEQTALTNITEIENVERVHPNFELSGASARTPAGVGQPSIQPPDQSIPSIVSQETTYGLDMLDVPQAWEEFDTRGEGATIAVLDSGVAEEAHPDLAVSNDGWRDFINSKQEPYDDHGHGTSVSGVVGGETAHGTHYGVAPDATLLHAKVLDENNRYETKDVIRSIEWVVEHDQDVDAMVMSLESDDRYVTEFIEPVRNARESGIMVVGISGNVPRGEARSPGNVYETVAVGSVTESRDVAEDSGGKIIDTSRHWTDYPDDWPEEYAVPDTTAPGVDVISARPDGDFYYHGGTSYAAPHVAGVIALMESVSDDNLSPDEVESVLHETAQHPEEEAYDIEYGHGIVNAYAAVDAVTERSPELVLAEGLDDVEAQPGDEEVVLEHQLTNEGDALSDPREISLYVSDSEVDTATVDSAPRIIELTLPVDEFETGSHSMTLTTGDEEYQADLTVSPAGFIITSVDVNGEVVQGETVSIEPTIKNPSAVEVTEIVVVTAGDTEVARDEVTIAAQDAATVSYEWTVDEEPEDEHDLSISVEEDQFKTQVEADRLTTDSEPTDMTDSESGDTVPGMGVAVASIAVILFSVVAIKRD